MHAKLGSGAMHNRYRDVHYTRVLLCLFGLLMLVVALRIWCSRCTYVEPRTVYSFGKSETREEVFQAIGLSIQVQCQAMARLGHPRSDGGWNTCILPDLTSVQSVLCLPGDYRCEWGAHRKTSVWPPANCTVFSFGSAGDFSFDLAARSLGCDVHVFDPSMRAFVQNGMPKLLKDQTGISFYDVGLANRDYYDSVRGWKMMRLQTLMRMVQVEQVEILKMDIEGDEWGVLDDLFNASPPEVLAGVNQILMELHFNSGSAKDTEHIKTLMGRFNELGFRLWSRDENLFCDMVDIGLPEGLIRKCLELSFIRVAASVQ